MIINATLLGEVILTSIILITLLSYYLAKRKTHTPKLATLIGSLLAIIPPLGLIYLALLVLKKDIQLNDTDAAVN